MTLLEAVRKLGDHAQLHMNLGLLYSAMDQLEPARKHLLKAVECDCTSSPAWKYLALVESARKDFYHARQAFHRACMLDPADLVLAYQLSLAADAAGKAGFPAVITLPEFARPAVNSQIRQLAEYVASEPDFVEACIALPPSAADNQLFDMLVCVLRTALAYHPNYADLHYLLSVSLERLGQIEPARHEAAAAVEVNGRYAKAMVQLASLESQLDRRMEAIAHYRQALAIGAEWPDVHVALGRLLHQTGMTASAGEHYRRALALNTNYKQAQEALAALAA
jgi:tetratricopeptide (TPR) repeat protein